MQRSIRSSFFERLDKAVADDDLEALKRLSKEMFQATEAGPTPFSAALKPTPYGREVLFAASAQEAAVEPRDEIQENALILNAANAVERAARHVAYRRKLRKEPNAVRIVAEGDSWFQYPVVLEDVIDVLMEKYAVYCLSAAGDTVEAMVRSGEYLDVIADKKPAVFLFSGGGNDLVGDGRLRSILRPFDLGSSPADLIDKETFGQALSEVVAGYERILAQLEQQFPTLKMLAHSYDHPQRIIKGPWIWPYMQEKGIPEQMANAVVAEMLDQFGIKLVSLGKRFHNFVYVPVTGSVGSAANDWYDALHPANPGFRNAAGKFALQIDALVSKPTGVLEILAPARATFGRVAAEAMAPMQDAQRAEPARKTIKRIYEFAHSDYPVWEDFGPEEGWLQFADADVHKHIRDVISLLKVRHVTEAPELIANRASTRPFATIGRSMLPRAEGSEAIAEAIVGGNDLEPIQHLLVGYNAAKAVGRIARLMSTGAMHALGTGYLVAPGLLLTNHHVFPSQVDATRCVLLMDDEEILVGEARPPRRYRITRDIYFADAVFDFAFASVEPTSNDGTALSGYGSLSLRAEPGKAIKGETLSIIQHPAGGPKAISIRNGLLMGRIEEGVYYTADTKPGSSGSVVLNREWEVVALHHRTVPHPTIRGEYLANRGVRISSILARVKEAAADHEEQASRVDKLLGAASGEGPREALGQLQPTSMEQPLETDDGEDLQTALFSKPDGDEESELALRLQAVRPATEAAAARLPISKVGWVQAFANNPDYWHLPAAAEGVAFDVTPVALEALIVAGRYSPHVTAEGILIVGVRGAAIIGDDQVLLNKQSVRLREQKPDHRQFRCVVLVLHKPRGLISAFKASTVPNRGGVVAQYNLNQGFPGEAANMLPTGCYELCVGTHSGSVVVPTVLRLGTGPTPSTALRVTTLRTLNDGVYGAADFWDNCRPMDNIHPAFSASSAEFSSLGCLTIAGSYSGGVHTGNWARFRETALFNSKSKMGTRYNLVLTSGMELAAIAAAGSDTAALRALARLSHGSQGDEVKSLQRALGLAESGICDAGTKKALTELERQRLGGRASGIYSMRSEREFGLGIWTTS